MAKKLTDIRSLARGHTKTAIRTLASIMQSPKAPHGARVAAATALLERGWGKADQTINVKGTIEHQLVKMVQDLDNPKPVNGKVVDHEETEPGQQLSPLDYA